MDSSTPYVCNNAPRPEANLPIWVQDGWAYKIGGGIMTRTPKMVQVPFVMEVECQYDKDDKDSRCKGCKNGVHARLKECDHRWRPYPIARVDGTEWCSHCHAVRPEELYVRPPEGEVK